MPFLYARQNPLDDARHTFSSWDNCMAKAYCKWPVIVAIVVGSLIVFSVVFCIARCLCCAAECTICCCKCCTCCCPSGSGRSGHRRMKSQPAFPPYAPNPHAPSAYNANPYAQAHAAAPAAPLNQQYHSHAAPSFTPAPVQERPQFATFDSPSKRVNDDALPSMPVWADSRDRYVAVEEQVLPQKNGDMEMDRLDRNGSVTNASMAGMAAGPRRSPVPARSPIPSSDGYGYNQGYENRPLMGATPHRSPNASPAPYGNSMPYAQQDDYRRAPPAQHRSPVYGAGEGYAQNEPYDRQSPAPQHQPYDQYDQQDYHSAYASVPPSYHSSPPPPAQGFNSTPYDNFAPPSTHPTHTPEYSYPDPARAAELPTQPTNIYPGQRTYTPQPSSGTSTYQAFNPGSQTSGLAR